MTVVTLPERATTGSLVSREPLSQWPVSLNFPELGLPPSVHDLTYEQQAVVAHANRFVANFETARPNHWLALFLQRQILDSDNIHPRPKIIDCLARPFAALSCVALAQSGLLDVIEHPVARIRSGRPLFEPVGNGGLFIDGEVFAAGITQLNQGVPVDLSRRAPHDAAGFLYTRDVVSTFSPVEKLPRRCADMPSAVMIESWPRIFPVAAGA